MLSNIKIIKDIVTQNSTLLKYLTNNSKFEIKFKKFKKFKKEYQALLIVFYGDLNFSENFNIESWNNYLETTDLIDNKEEVNVYISELLN